MTVATPNDPAESNGTLRVILFGGLRVAVGETEPVSLTSRRAGLLLARLTVRAGQRTAREELAVSMWPDSDISSARRNLRQAIFGLRQALEAMGWNGFQTDDEACWLDADSMTSDYHDLIRANRAAELEALQIGIQAYQGQFLGTDEDDWAADQRDQCERIYLELLGKAARQLAKAGQLTEAIAYAREAARHDPLSEDARYRLIRLYLVNREFSAAKQEYLSLEHLLRETLGATPARSFVQLQGTTNARDADDDAISPPGQTALRSEPAVPARRRPILLAGIGFLVIAAFGGSMIFPRSAEPKRDYETLYRDFRTAAATDDLPRQARNLDGITELAHRDVYGAQEEIWKLRLAPDLPAYEKVIGWTLRQDPALGIRIGGRLERYALLSGRIEEWKKLMRQALPLAARATPEDRARFFLAYAFATSDDRAPVANGVREALQHYRATQDLFGEGQALRAQGYVAASKYTFDVAHQRYDEALSIFRQDASDPGIAVTQLCIAITGIDTRESMDAGNLRRMEASLECFERFFALRNGWGIDFGGSVLINNALTVPVNEQTRPALIKAIDQLLQLADHSGRSSNFAAASETRLAAARVAHRAGDKAGVVRAIAAIGAAPYGSLLNPVDLYLLILGTAELEKDAPTRLITPEMISSAEGSVTTKFGKDFLAKSNFPNPASVRDRLLRNPLVK